MLSSQANTIIDTAACAATSGQLYSPQTVVAALEQGKRAAQHGCRMSLPVLLDVVAIFSSPRSFTPIFRHGSASRSQATVDYDEWLVTTCGIARRHFSRQEREAQKRSNQPAGRAGHDLLPFLLHVWTPLETRHEGSVLEWAKAYTELLTDVGCQRQIYNGWSGARRFESHLWQWWPGKPPPCPLDPHLRNKPPSGRPTKSSADLRAPLMQGELFSIFYVSNNPPRRERDWIYENFDHGAGHLYLFADELQLLPDQIKRIQRLRRRRREYISVPVTTSHEEQDPYYGHIALATLCSGEYGEFKIINSTDPRISNPPSSLPPQPIRIHLCWAHGYAGLEQEHSLLVNANGRARSTSASTLQGMVALLLDDWLKVLKDLPIRYYLHRGYPNPMSIEVGKDGKGWQLDTQRGNPLPPVKVINTLFQRPTYVDISVTDMTWQMDGRLGRTYSNWWCSCALRSDLPEFGFTAQEEANRSTMNWGEPAWVAEKSPLPESISHLIVIDPPAGIGDIYRVERRRGSNYQVELRPIPRRHGLSNDPDPSFGPLRCQTLDALLDVLEIKMF